MRIIIFFLSTILFITNAYYNFSQTMGFLLALSWGFANFYFIKQLLYIVLVEKQKKFWKIALALLIKFPILYGAGLALLYYQSDILGSLLAGFTVALILNIQQRRIA